MTVNKIVHGDSRLLIPKIKTPINCVIADPPYGINFRSNVAKSPDGLRYAKEIEGDLDIEGALKLFDEVMQVLMPKLADQCEMYIFTAWNVLDRWMPLLRSYPDIKLKQMLVWDKGYPGLGDLEGNWGCGHEIVLYLKKGRRPIPLRRSAIIHVDKLPKLKNWHATQKPVALIERLIEMSTDPGDLIVDPFSGSGSTSVAAQNLGRNSLAFEIDERWIAHSREALRQQPLFAG